LVEPTRTADVKMEHLRLATVVHQGKPVNLLSRGR